MRRRLVAGGLAGAAMVVVLAVGAVAVGRSGYHYGAADFTIDAARAGDRQKLESRFVKPPPAKVYVVVDRTHNRLELRKGNAVTLTAVCSAGSGFVLREPEVAGKKGRTWTFDTPRGIFRVIKKITSPAWRRPDWAFIEAGEPIPKNDGERIEYGMMGEYALSFGNGFLIHGTLYERLLGRGVTHGCVRLGRDDLAKVYSECPVGTPIYIF